MVFLNRKRAPLQKTTKDPSKYWYVEKYVYGVLKETVEVALGTGIKFTGIESGYIDDEFAGWSKTSTSTTRTFNTTTTYKNTTTSVKKYLDSENTIKLYAVYKYNVIELKSTVEINYGAQSTSTGNSKEYEYATVCSGTFRFYGYTEHTGSGVGGSTYNLEGLTFAVTYSDGLGREQKENFSIKNTKDSYVDKTYPAGSHIKFTLTGYHYSTSTAGGQYISYAKIDDITNAHQLSLYDCNNFAYRVESHT